MGIFLFVGLLSLYTYFEVRSVGHFSDFKKNYPISDKYLLSSDGRVISSFRSDLKKRNIAWFSLDEINNDFQYLLLKQEDRNFYSHMGVDFKALGAAALNFVSGKNNRGASTISMQLSKNINSLNTRSLNGKFKQIVGALKIESSWSKAEILEAYLNLIYLHGQIQGVGTASLALFNKSPLYLTADEQTTLLKLIKSPNLLINNRSIAASEVSRNLNITKNLAFHYHKYLIKSSSMPSNRSTVDYDLQNLVQQSIMLQVQNLKNSNVHDAAVVVLDNKTGTALAYAGSSGSLSRNPYVDMAQAKRQAGSTLKPFLYATALQKNILATHSWIEDSPVEIVFANGIYSPKNHDQQFRGWVHPGIALGSSLNVPAVKTIQLVGVDAFWSTLKSLNFELEHEADFYGPSLALGVLDTSLWTLTQAYRSFAIGQNTAFNEQTRKRVIWMLARAQNRALGFGQDSILNIPQGFAVKTGTSKDMKDNWCVGFNSNYTIGVWVGNADNSPMRNVLGTTGAAPIWRQVVDYLLIHQKQTSEPLITSEEELRYLAEEQSSPRPPQTFAKNTITSPANSSIYAIDPGIPLKFQKLILQADGPQENLVWKFNGQILPTNKWTLKKGWQKIELYKAQQKVDETLFLVK